MPVVGQNIRGEYILMVTVRIGLNIISGVWQNEGVFRYIHPKTLRGPFCESADVSDTTYIDGRVAQKTIADLRRLKDESTFLLGMWLLEATFAVQCSKYWDLYQGEIQLASNPYRPKALPKQVTSSGEIRGYGEIYDNKG